MVMVHNAMKRYFKKASISTSSLIGWCIINTELEIELESIKTNKTGLLAKV